MLNMQVKDVVNRLVRSLLVGQGRKDEALYFNFDIRMSVYMDDKSYDQSRGLHLLYHLSPHNTYMDVFYGITLSPFGKAQDVKEWMHAVSHDSEWRNPNLFSEIYFEMASDINKELSKDGRTRAAPVDMYQHNGFGWGNSFFEWLLVKVDVDKEDSYRKLITLAK